MKLMIFWTTQYRSDCSGGRRDPDVSAGEFGEDSEGPAAVLGCGSQVGPHCGKVLRAGEGAHASGHLLLDLHHPDVALGGVVVEGHPRVGGKPQVVIDASADAPGQGAVAAADRSGRAGIGAAPTSAAETISRRWPARMSASGRVSVSVTALTASSASITWAAQHQPGGVSAPAGGWAVWKSTTAMSSRSRWALHNACRAAG